MKRRKDANRNNTVRTGQPPYGMIGAGTVTSCTWDSSDESEPLRFNVFRMDASTGEVEQQFVASDVEHLVRVAHLLAEKFSDEESLDQELRDDLSCLASCLGELLGYERPNVAERHKH